MTAPLETCLLGARFGILSSVQPREVLDAASAANMHLYTALQRDFQSLPAPQARSLPGTDPVSLSQFGASQRQSGQALFSVPTRTLSRIAADMSPKPATNPVLLVSETQYDDQRTETRAVYLFTPLRALLAISSDYVLPSVSRPTTK